MTDERSGLELGAELEDLRARLAEGEEVLHAIRNGEVDAVVVAGERGEQVYTLSGADRVYRQLIETMSEGAATLSADGGILYGNVRLAEMLGRPLDQVLGTALRDYLPPADQQALDAILAQARTEPSRREINLKTSEGRLVPVYLSASRLHSEGAEMVFCLVFTDLTEQKSHEQIVAAERLARLILEQAAEAIVVCDEQGRVIRASRVAQRFCDGSPLLRPFAEVFPLRTDASDPFHLAPVLEGETLRNVDVTLARQGQKLDLILTAGPLLSGRKILGCVVTMTDITERKRAEDEIRRLNEELERRVKERTAQLETLKESEERYRSLFEHVPVGLYRTTLEGQVLDVNPALVRLLGYPSREAMMTIHVPDGYRDEKERTRWQILMEREGVVRGAETQWRRFDGTMIWVRESALAIRDKEGRITHYEGVVEDVTEQKQAEETLRETNEYLDNLFNYANAPIIVWDPHSIITRFNRAFEELTGIPASEAVGQPLTILFPAENRDASMEKIRKAGAGERWEVIEIPIADRRTGSVRNILWNSANVLDRSGSRITSTIAQGQDITERKRAEEALQKRVKELRCIADISRLAEEPGISIEKFVQEVVSILPSAWLYPEICSARIAIDSKEFKTANFRETEWSQSADIKVDRMKFGALTVCYLEEKPEADEGPFFKEERSLINTVADFMGHVIQHRRTEVEIRDSEKRFRTIFDSANDGMLLADMEGKKFHSGNAAIYRMLGYSQEEIKKMGITDIHPEKDIPHVIEQFEKQTRKEIAIAQSLPMKRKDGSVFYADISSAPVEISGKRYLLGIFRDITERKRAEEQLQKSLQQTKKVLEDVVLTLSSIVEKRDPYTAGHQHRVADLACAIAGELNLPEVQIEGIRVAGIIHDIGKINVPAEILSKTGRLSDAEFNIIKTHAQVGKEILEPINFPWPVAQVVHQHHERLNGTGYPQGLSAEKIILEAKIIAVADVVEAMASHRPYRPALGIDKALEEISNKSGILYAPQVVDACRELFDKKGYKLA